jgi:apolipoprotein D and lipocalin family protein
MRSLAIALALAALAPAASFAAAQPPAKPVPASFYSGRWYEIARTPNGNQRGCEGSSNQFTASDGGALKVVQTCRMGSPAGKAKVFDTTGKIVSGADNTKFTMSFLGGLKKQEYWVLDRADDAGWAIMATPGGNFVWLLSRQPVMSAAAKAAALARVKALGYAKLEYPRQPPA